MTDEELAAVRARLRQEVFVRVEDQTVEGALRLAFTLHCDVAALLAEVDRLRAEVARLEEEGQEYYNDLVNRG